MTLGPAPMQLVDERYRSGVAKDLRGAAEALEEQNQVPIVADNFVGHIVGLVVGGKALALRHAHQETCQPAGEAAAKDQQVTAAELMQEVRGPVCLRLQ